jgi:hypothetical protein
LSALGWKINQEEQQAKVVSWKLSNHAKKSLLFFKNKRTKKGSKKEDSCEMLHDSR